MIVLDTEVLAELLRPEPDPTAMAWLAAQRRGELYTTAVSEAEVAAALASLPKGRRRDALNQAVARLLGEGLGGRILPFDRAAAAYGELTPKRLTSDEEIATAVGQVAAIARARGARLVATREAAAYLAQGGKCVDPWASRWRRKQAAMGQPGESNSSSGNGDAGWRLCENGLRFEGVEAREWGGAHPCIAVINLVDPSRAMARLTL